MSLILSLVLAAGTPTATAKLPTLEELLSAPFPTDLVAAPAGGRLAWVENDRGVRNVFLAEPPDFSPRSLTANTGDDGQELAELTFSPDGASLAFTRGGSPNGKGEIPNPSLDPAGVEQAVYFWSTQAPSPRRLGEGHSAVISSKGVVAFLKKGEVFTVEGAATPAPLFHARGQASDLRFSPDGSLLAFVSRRGDHAFVGVYDLARKTLTYLDPSADDDSDPVFSPDGTRIAFLRSATHLPFTFGPIRSAEPFSIRVADAKTGRGREVFHAEPGAGSEFHALPTPDQILWADGDRLVFPWEKTKWVQLYSVPLSGGAPLRLTRGDSEVEYVALTADRKSVLYNSNEGDVNRRHLFSVPAAGGAVVPLTHGDSIEWSPAPGGDGKTVAFLQSDAQRPPHPVLFSPGQPARDLGRVPKDFPASSLLVPEAVVFSAADGMPIHGQLFHPAGGTARHPAVVFFHGGSRRQMLLGWHYNEYYKNAYAMNQYLASRGFLVLSVNYRSGIGYGLDFREAVDYGAHGASEFADVLGAGLYLRSRGDVDPKRIGAWGGSYGGFLTALALARASDLFAAGVDFHGVHDWNTEIPTFAPGYHPEKDALTRIAAESSPMAWVAGWRSPVLLIHGDDDRNVPFNQTVTLLAALREKGVEVEELVFPDEVHDFLLHSSWLAGYHAAADFLDRRLRPR